LPSKKSARDYQLMREGSAAHAAKPLAATTPGGHWTSLGLLALKM
jgi:hypothetical protein